ncbi:3-oxoacyl-[acyl-carrier-protein] synthase III C-terminal domain-containing protein, partial [Pseudomonas bubulae]|uniref:3-oxoacyl-[acyl-carrier-protein] synthase III C-terminal domain-containing protein n=1 Tax=Pseudomonas bubulae TaxID=2316085 RepID=UPI00277D0B53
RRFEGEPEKFIKDMVETGNTVSSSIPLLLEKHVMDATWKRVAPSPTTGPHQSRSAPPAAA